MRGEGWWMFSDWSALLAEPELAASGRQRDCNTGSDSRVYLFEDYGTIILEGLQPSQLIARASDSDSDQ